MTQYRYNEFYEQYEIQIDDEWRFFCWDEEEHKLQREGINSHTLPIVNVEYED